jgi:hypothetical protein
MIDIKLNKFNGSEVDAVKQKIFSCCSENEGFEILCKISYVLERKM